MPILRGSLQFEISWVLEEGSLKVAHFTGLRAEYPAVRLYITGIGRRPTTKKARCQSGQRNFQELSGGGHSGR
jgi:hypothetical protein